MNRQDEFLRLSEALTGFGRFELLGTGLADVYLRLLEDVLPQQLLGTLLGILRNVPAGAAEESAIAAGIFAEPSLKPVAHNLIVLWYCGTWMGLPDEWRAVHGRSPLDTARTISAEAYLAGLQWAAAGAHPAGGQMQGFGAWSMAPEVTSDE